MSQTEGIQLARCIEPDCEDDAEYVTQERGGVRLFCEADAPDDAVPLGAFDFGYGGRYKHEDMPEDVARLESVAHQVCEYWWKESMFPGDSFVTGEDRDDRTVSIVVRDGDGEIRGETRPWEFAGIYALVRIQPRDVEEWPEARDDGPPGLPDWAEWIHVDPPMHHHVEGVRCSECGEQDEFMDSRMPEVAARREPWDRIHHRADCSQADDRDKEIWFGKQYAVEVRSRPSPQVMALDCIWEEITELHLNRGRPWTDTAIDNRFNAIFRALKSRMQPNYPACPECGGEIQRVDEWGLECSECYSTIREETYQAWWDQHRRLWGTRGQGDRGYSVPDANERGAA